MPNSALRGRGVQGIYAMILRPMKLCTHTAVSTSIVNERLEIVSLAY